MDLWWKCDQHRLPSLDDIGIRRLCELSGGGELVSIVGLGILERVVIADGHQS